MSSEKCGQDRWGVTNCDNPRQEPHTCPYKVELLNDSDFLCTCCTECTHDCADEV